jgi:hypothetical protein
MKNVISILIALPLLILLPLNASARVNGVQTTTNVTIKSSTVWTVVSAKPFNTPNPQTCTVSGSADASNPNKKTLDNQYRFTLTMDNANPGIDGGCERLLEFDDNASIDDEDTKQIGSTCLFTNVGAGQHTVRWLARKVAKTPAAPDMVVTDNSLTISCTDNPL